MLAGFQTALNTFSAEGNYPKEIILVSDGMPNAPDAVSGFVGNFEGIPVYSIGVGGGYNTAFLQNVAGTTGGQFFAADDLSDLAGVFEEIASEGITQVASDQTAGLPFWFSFNFAEQCHCLWGQWHRMCAPILGTSRWNSPKSLLQVKLHPFR